MYDIKRPGKNLFSSQSIKDVEQVHIGERKKYCVAQFLWKKFVVFGSNSSKCKFCLIKTFRKNIILQHSLLVTHEVSILFLCISIVKETEMA